MLSAQPGIDVVGGARSVQDALVQARLHKPDCILMDFSLPDGTGLEAAQAIRAEFPDVKIIFLTMHEDEDKIFDAIRQGAHRNTSPLISLWNTCGHWSWGNTPFLPSTPGASFTSSPIHL